MLFKIEKIELHFYKYDLKVFYDLMESGYDYKEYSKDLISNIDLDVLCSKCIKNNTTIINKSYKAINITRDFLINKSAKHLTSNFNKKKYSTLSPARNTVQNLGTKSQPFFINVYTQLKNILNDENFSKNSETQMEIERCVSNGFKV